MTFLKFKFRSLLLIDRSATNRTWNRYIFAFVELRVLNKAVFMNLMKNVTSQVNNVVMRTKLHGADGTITQIICCGKRVNYFSSETKPHLVKKVFWVRWSYIFLLNYLTDHFIIFYELKLSLTRDLVLEIIVVTFKMIYVVEWDNTLVYSNSRNIFLTMMDTTSYYWPKKEKHWP